MAIFIRSIFRIIFLIVGGMVGLLLCFAGLGLLIDFFSPTKSPKESSVTTPLTDSERESIKRKVSFGVASPLKQSSSPMTLLDPGSTVTKGGMDYTTVLEDYENNEIAAEQKYKGRRFRVKGPIGSIGKDILGSPYVTLGSSLPSLQCVFSRSSAEYLALLNKGELASFECTVSGKMINVLLKECTP